jgi:hypothetical protein
MGEIANGFGHLALITVTSVAGGIMLASALRR